MCLYCDEKHTDLPNLHQHTASAHNTVTEPEVRKAVNRTRKQHRIKVNFMSLTCKVCESSFGKFEEMKSHINSEHDKSVDVVDDGVFPYKILDRVYDCLLCGISFKNYVVLNRHINSHFPYFVCNQCGEGCSTAQRLREHNVYHHADRLHCCEICQKSFPTASRKKWHVSSVHLKLQKKKCSLCSDTFTDYNEKVQHLKSVHGKLCNSQCSSTK
jgi:hypothetical protein